MDVVYFRVIPCTGEGILSSADAEIQQTLASSSVWRLFFLPYLSSPCRFCPSKPHCVAAFHCLLSIITLGWPLVSEGSRSEVVGAVVHSSVAPKEGTVAPPLKQTQSCLAVARAWEHVSPVVVARMTWVHKLQYARITKKKNPGN